MTEKVKVLLVEDTLTQALILKRILESKASYSVTIAASAEKALELVYSSDDNKFDFVLADVNLPEMDGYDLVKAIRTNPATAGMTVVLLASLINREDILQIIECGADNFLYKTYDDEYLLRRLSDIIASVLMRKSGEKKEACKWKGVFGKRISIASIETDRAVDMLLSSFDTNVQQKRVASKVTQNQ